MEELRPDSTITLNNGVKMPLFGYSLENIGKKVYNQRTQMELLLDAIETGYRFFDTCEDDGGCYGGIEALGRAIKKSGIPRSEFFISSKMRLDEMSDGRYYQAIDETLYELQSEYLDLYSIHWPLKINMMWPRLDSFVGAYAGREISKTDNGDAEGLIEFYNKGLARAIGVCNMEIHHLSEILNNSKCTIVPQINQSHFHPLYMAEELRNFCAEHKIAFGALFDESELNKPTKPQIYTDVNRIGAVFQTDEDHVKANQSYVRIIERFRSKELQRDPFAREKNPRRPHDFYDDFEAISRIAKKYDKTNNQLVTRWSLQHGVVTTVKGLVPEKMKEDFNVFDFAISDEDMQKIDSFDIGMRIGYHPDYIDFF
jgi:diketogulonate reductase-like aldo/keto reductase